MRRETLVDTATAIERFIVDEILLGSESSIDPNRSLVGDSVLNSLALIRLIGYIEEHFGITVEDGEVVYENFDSVAAITAFIHDRQ